MIEDAASNVAACASTIEPERVLPVDRAYLFTWYDLPDLGGQEYLSWFHERYLPQILERDGILWGAHYEMRSRPVLSGAANRIVQTDDPAVPRGVRFVAAFGAETSSAFLLPTQDEIHAMLPEADQAQLALRHGVRSSVMIEDGRVDGGAARAMPDGQPGPVIQLGTFNTTPDFDAEVGAWFARWRLPSLEGMPGVVRVRRLVGVTGWSRHGCLYEFASEGERDSNFVGYEAAYPEMAAWTDRVTRRLVHMPGSPGTARRIWPPSA